MIVERQRILPEGQPHLALVLLLDLLDRRHHARAERALEVRELDDLHGRRLRPDRRRVARIDLVDRLVLGRSTLRRLRRRGRHFGLGVLHHRVVELGRRRALLHERVRVLQLLVDLGLERLERLRADERLAVDEERGCAARADLVALGLLGVDLLLPLARVQVGLELLHVQADLARVLLQGRALERGLVGEQLLVHLPELALRLGRQRRLGRQVRVVVERQR